MGLVDLMSDDFFPLCVNYDDTRETREAGSWRDVLLFLASMSASVMLQTLGLGDWLRERGGEREREMKQIVPVMTIIILVPS